MLVVTIHAFVGCWFGSKLFFESFGMEYHFRVSPRWVWNGTPAFLYFMTVAYFATYYLVMGLGWRAFRRRWPRAPRRVGLLVRALLCYAMAFAETATMAVEVLRPWFSYRDPRWVMWWGSFCYGTLYFVTLPQLTELDEEAPTPIPWTQLVTFALGQHMIVLVCYEVYGRVLGAMR